MFEERYDMEWCTANELTDLPADMLMTSSLSSWSSTVLKWNDTISLRLHGKLRSSTEQADGLLGLIRR